MECFLCCVAFVGLFLFILYILSLLILPKPVKLDGAHVLVTGGSSGIGKSLAIEVAKRGGNVSLLARNQTRLSEAQREVETHMKDKTKQKVVCISVDVSEDYIGVEKAVKQAEERLGPVDILVNSAGTSQSAAFEDIPLQAFKKLMEINYLGSVYATRAALKSMKEQKRGRIVFVSSQAGQVGLYGFTAYSASKFALRGLAESLQMEVKPHNIYVTLAFPPDTDTPGFAQEQIGKPEETKLISETSGLFQADLVAKTILQDSIKGRFLSYMGLDGYMLSSLTCGMSPVVSLLDLAQQVITMGVFRLVSIFYVTYFDRIIKTCKKKKEAQTSATS